VLVEEEELLARPHLGAVVGDEHRQVAEQANAPGASVLAQTTPLAIEAVLDELLVRDGLRVLPPGSFERGRSSSAQGSVPLGPGDPVGGAQGAIEREVGQPALGALAEGVERQRAGPRAAAVSLPGQAQPRLAVARRGGEAGRAAAERLGCDELGAGQQPIGVQILEIDEPGVAGEGRLAVVGREAPPHRTHRQHLPPGLLRGRQRGDEVATRRAEVPVAVWAGE
jgi:hypothetical protein